MTNTAKVRDFPANKALRCYLEDLISPAATQVSAPETKTSRAQRSKVQPALNLNQDNDFALLDDSIQSKISQAERLIVKANQSLTLAAEPSCEIVDTQKEPLEKSLSIDKVNTASADINTIGTSAKSKTRDISIALKESLDNRFQVLLCEIANVTIAIPLVELGGIHKLTKISSMAQQPSWCKGILIKGKEKFTCIDVGPWLIPTTSNYVGEASEYKFAVQLGKSPYVLCCNSISSTVDLVKDDVKWREHPSVRPWLAGLLKERMCALIDGAHMVQEVLN